METFQQSFRLDKGITRQVISYKIPENFLFTIGFVCNSDQVYFHALEAISSIMFAPSTYFSTIFPKILKHKCFVLR